MSSKEAASLPFRWLKPSVEYGPLLVFLLVYMNFGLLIATAALMAATAIGLIFSLLVERRIPLVPLMTAIVVGIFGGLTLWLNDQTFIKMKPTIVQGLLSSVLFGGLAFGRAFLKPVFGLAWRMDEVGWEQLTMRYALFFAAMALLNEVVWRTQTTDVWVLFKVFGILGLTIVFALSQTPLMARHHLPESGETGH